MKLATFTHNKATRIGVVVEDSIVDLARGAGTAARDDRVSRRGQRRAANAPPERYAKDSRTLPLTSVKLEAPIARPPEFLAIGLNYADHVAETRMKAPEFPMFFNKQSTCVTGPCDPIHLPRVVERARLRRRARNRDRQAMPPCAPRSCA